MWKQKNLIKIEATKTQHFKVVWREQELALAVVS